MSIMENPKYQIDKSKDDQFYFVLKATNGEIILTSEMYTAKHSCEKGIESVRANCQNNAQYERLRSTVHHWYFNLKATNHEIVGTSEMYTTEAARENGIGSVKENGPTERVEDLTVAVV